MGEMQEDMEQNEENTNHLAYGVEEETKEETPKQLPKKPQRTARPLGSQIRKPGAREQLKALFIGPPNHGKTHLLGTAGADPRTAPILVLDFEGGETTLAGAENVDVWPIRNWKDYDEAYTYLKKGGHPYKSIGVDSLSETHTFAIIQILDENANKRDDPDQVQLNDYGKSGFQIKRLIREFRDLPYHTFFTAHSKEIEESKIGKIKVPALSGQLASDAAGMMDVVAYLALVQDRVGAITGRALLLHGDKHYRIKARAPWGKEVPEYIEEPTITTLMDALGYKK